MKGRQYLFRWVLTIQWRWEWAQFKNMLLIARDWRFLERSFTLSFSCLFGIWASWWLQLIAGPLLSVVHIYCVCEEMRAAPVNTLNPQRTAMIVADFLKVMILATILRQYKIPSFHSHSFVIDSMIDRKSLGPSWLKVSWRPSVPRSTHRRSWQRESRKALTWCHEAFTDW